MQYIFRHWAVSSGWHRQLPAVNAPLECLLRNSEHPLMASTVYLLYTYGVEHDIARSFVLLFDRIRIISVEQIITGIRETSIAGLSGRAV